MTPRQTGATIRRLRHERGETQEQLAKRARISRPYLTQLENGDRKPSLAIAKKLAVALGVSLDELA